MRNDQTTSGPTAAEAVEKFENFTQTIGKSQQMMMEYWTAEAAKEGGATDFAEGMQRAGAYWAELGRAFASADQARLAEIQQQWWSDSLRLMSGVMSGDASQIPPAADVKDRRFGGDAWAEQPVYDLIRRSYLLASHHLSETVASFEHLPEAERDRLRFQAKQFVDAMSPANFAALNPEVLAEAKRTNGQSLLDGVTNMLEDVKRGRLTMTDESAFEVGRNVAATPGRIVYENRLFQLIQYMPTTETVYETPLLIFPPWINKYYILDLTPQKSFIRWAVEQGLTVFVVSWHQAGPETADVTLDNFVQEGMATAIDQVLSIAGAPSTHTIGYCVAGTTLAITLAWLDAHQQAEKVKSTTFFTAQVDFTEAGELLHFVTEPMIESIEKLSVEKGYLDGRWLSATFNLLRPTDLMWNYVVNNYLKGKEYSPFDLLYWNSDPTNVPAKWHLSYIKDLYRDNLLVEPGGISVDNVPIDLKRIKTPMYIQAGKEDHIAPAKSCYKLTTAFSGHYRFMLAGSGHIAGVVNPPSQQKYQYWTLPEGTPTPDTLDGFIAAAYETKGSWWPDWIAWLAPQSGNKVAARQPGETPGHPVIEDAPGRYVKERIE